MHSMSTLQYISQKETTKIPYKIFIKNTKKKKKKCNLRVTNTRKVGKNYSLKKYTHKTMNYNKRQRKQFELLLTKFQHYLKNI